MDPENPLIIIGVEKTDRECVLLRVSAGFWGSTKGEVSESLCPQLL